MNKFITLSKIILHFVFRLTISNNQAYFLNYYNNSVSPCKNALSLLSIFIASSHVHTERRSDVPVATSLTLGKGLEPIFKRHSNHRADAETQCEQAPFIANFP